jgi:hypothetical protein
VTHEFVIALQPVDLDRENGLVVRNPDQEITAFGVEEGCGGLENLVSDDLVVSSGLPKIPMAVYFDAEVPKNLL